MNSVFRTGLLSFGFWVTPSILIIGLVSVFGPSGWAGLMAMLGAIWLSLLAAIPISLVTCSMRHGWQHLSFAYSVATILIVIGLDVLAIVFLQDIVPSLTLYMLLGVSAAALQWIVPVVYTRAL